MGKANGIHLGWSRGAFVFLWLLVVVCGGGATASSGQRFQETVYGSFVDGISLSVDAALGNQELARLGLVDVTAPPFSADPSGKIDATTALQAAIDFARDRQMVCFLPSGVYRISDTLRCVQYPYRRSTGVMANGANFPCILLGSRKGKRPVIRLAPGSSGYGSVFRPKYVIHFWAVDKYKGQEKQPNIAMNQQFINIDVVVGPGNPAAVAIRHRGAQGCSVQEATIDVRHGLTGIEGGCGSGGSFSSLTVIGGEVGLDLRETQPAPTLSGIKLVRQRKTALLYGGRQSLSAVGLDIIAMGRGPAVKAVGYARNPARGHFVLVDASIRFEGAAGDVAIAGERNIYCNNVYVSNAKVLIENSGQKKVPAISAAGARIVEYAHGATDSTLKGYRYTYPVYRGSKKVAGDLVNILPGAFVPPQDLRARHSISSYPVWETEGVNAKDAPFNAKGDGIADDSHALQQVIDSHETVFLPKGVYRISKTLQLKKNTRLVGLSNVHSVIMAAEEFSGADGGPVPLVRTADSGAAETQLCSLALFVPKEAENVFLLEWQSGKKSFLANVNFLSQPPRRGYANPKKVKAKNYPLVLVSGHGAGRWWNFFQEDPLGQGPLYRHLAIDGTAGPFIIYQCNPEHARAEANIEIRSARNVRIFGLKGEGNSPVLLARNADNVDIFGYGGNAAALPGKALFVLEGTSNVRIVNAVDAPRLGGEGSEQHYAGVGVDPDKWSMISENNGGKQVGTRQLERPALYMTE